MIKLPSLHLNSEYSLLESTIKIDDLIKFAQQEDLKQLVITDRNNMYGVANFIDKCNKKNIKPIIGLDLDVENFRVVLLAKNYPGYKQLMQLSSLREKNNEVKLEQIISEDLFIIDHPQKGYFAINKKIIDSKNYFIGSNSNEDNSVIFNETKIFKQEENQALELLHSIKYGDKLKQDYKPLKIEADESLKATSNTLKILETCNIEFPKDVKILPEYPVEGEKSKLDFLKDLLTNSFKNKVTNEKQMDVYKKRLMYEVEIINQLGFIDYFLIIWDLIKWAKKNKIAVGPGRGSAAGSLTSYLLDITEVDPIEFGLLFERFLNPERISMPDIDIDIQDSRRDEVIEYLFNKYGKENVGLISAFSTIGAKTALRDVGRYLGMPLRDVDALSKMISLNTSLQETYDNKTRFRAAISGKEEFTNLFNKALMIEGLPRQKGTHAAGIVISDSNLENKVPTTYSADGHNQCQYSMKHLEEHGLLKIDLLGLRNLSIIQDIQKEIFKNYNKKVDLNKIVLNDQMTNKLLTSGDTNGVFQLESYGMKNTLIKVGVDNFDDLVSIISLFRPGPMEFIPEYADVKKGLIKIKKVHPIYDAIVEPTKGIIVYQEQIMKIAQSVSNMSFGSADILRRAISKKDLDVMETLKQKFVDGALKTGLTEEQAKIIYNNIEKFANYGFNKSHAVSYGKIAYWLAFFKARFSLEFYIAMLKNSLGSLKQVEKYLKELRRTGVQVISPNVNCSKATIYSENKIITLPLSIIKGFGEVANKKVTQAIEKYNIFDDFFDFVVKVKSMGLEKGQIETLIKGGALRDFANVKTLLESLPAALRYADMTTEKKDDNVEIYAIKLPKPVLVEVERDVIFELDQEKKLFGFNMNTFPTSKYENDIKIANIEVGKAETLPVLVESVREIKDKNGKLMWIAQLSDSSKTVEVMIFSSVVEKIGQYKKGDVVKTRIANKEFKGKNGYSIGQPWEVINE